MQISTVMLKDLNPEMRIDAEYYRAEILNRIDILDKKNNVTLDKLVDFVVGPFGSTITVDKYVDDSDFRYVRNKDINDFVITNNDSALIPEPVYSSLTQFHIKEYDILLTVVGTLGKAAIALKKDTKSIFSCKSTLLRTKSINPYYLITYLNSSTGQLFILRGKRGAIQEGLNLFDLKEIKVFLPIENFQEIIGNIVQNSFSMSEKSQYLYNQAQTLLLSELGLLDWKPKHQLSFVKNYSDTQQAGRFDAEYFQPKYDEIDVAIKNYSGGWDKLGTKFKLNKKGFKIDENKEFNYLEIGSINTSSGEIETQNLLGKELPANAKILLSKDDLLVSKVRTYRGAVAIIERDDLVGSGAFAVLRETGAIKKETLYVLLKSLPYLEFSLKFNSGTSYPVIGDDDILNYPLPLIKDSTQDQILQKISESFNLRKQSKHLLECAKQAVEMAIEKDEETAMQWLESQIDSIERGN